MRYINMSSQLNFVFHAHLLFHFPPPLSDWLKPILHIILLSGRKGPTLVVRYHIIKDRPFLYRFLVKVYPKRRNVPFRFRDWNGNVCLPIPRLTLILFYKFAGWEHSDTSWKNSGRSKAEIVNVLKRPEAQGIFWEEFSATMMKITLEGF